MKLKRFKIKSINLPSRLLLVTIAIIFSFSVPVQLFNKYFVSASPQTDALQAEIDAINADIAVYNAESSRLQGEAQTLQNAVAQLSAQKSVIQAQLDVSQIKYDKLLVQIKETEQKIADNKEALGLTIANMYVGDDITPIEMLASSNNIGDFLDKQEYHSSVRTQLTAMVEETQNLKKALDVQKIESKRVLDDQTNQRNALAAKEAEQQYLLNSTKGQEAAYQNLIAQKTADRADKQAQIDYYNSLASRGGSTLLAGDPGNGGYPSYLADSYQDSVVDPWGMYNRECVSYTAWKVYQRYGNMPYWGGIGNAWEWPRNAINSGIPVGSEPKVGSVAIADRTGGNPYGHAAWVEAVLPDNKIKISQYNWYVASLGGWGKYSEMIVDKSIFYRYVYFGEW